MSHADFQLTTARLVLREFQETDAPALYALNSDPDVMRYTGDSPFNGEPEALAFIRSYDHYRQEGFGRWAVCLPESNQLIGFCGLRRQEHSGEVDLAFRFSRDYWSQGYATEASAACLRAGFQHFNLKTITGRAMRENLPSITVLQKLGMKYRDMIEELGDFWLVYAVDAERFLLDYRHRS